MIDADALKIERGMADRCEDCKHDARMCQFNQYYTRMDICGMLDDAPTIPAIPLDWMREKMDGYAAKLRSTELAALVTVMQMWEQEGK